MHGYFPIMLLSVSRKLLLGFLTILLLVLCSFCLYAQTNDTNQIKLLFAGDVMGHDAQINVAWDARLNSYNFEPVFRYISGYIQVADIAVVNLEVTLAGPPYKGYPEFSSPDELAHAARDAGFDVFLQANNHALDRGQNGFKRTIAVLDSLNVLHTGTFLNETDRQKNHPLILEKNSIRIALLNYTYGTNGLVIPEPFIINRIDTLQIREDIEKAKRASPDFIVIAIHWGNEYERFENQSQRDLAQFMLNCGADAVIGSHPHVVQPVQLFYSNDTSGHNIVAYSLGNFVSNQRDHYRDGGIVFEIVLEKTAGKTHVKDYSYLPYWVYREDLTERSAFYVLPVSYFENCESLFNLKEYDQYKITRFAGDTRTHLEGIPENSFYDSLSR
ncbi:MAG: CapA family protein [Bacteroidales bacterium]|nr:CapA family protein [Bacteroidales bacterium]